MIEIDGENLTIEDVWNVAHGARVKLASGVAEKIKKSRMVVERLAEGNKPVYGINTGFGELASVRIKPEEAKKLQRNLILSHACGVGEPLSDEIVRAMMILRANALAKGYSGIRGKIKKVLAAQTIVNKRKRDSHLMKTGMHRIILAISMLVVLPAFAPPAFTAALNGSNNCGSCHGSFNPFKFSFDAPKEAPEGVEFDFKAKVRNPWTHQVSNMSVTLYLNDAPGLSFAGTSEPSVHNFSGAAGLLAPASEHKFAIDANAARISVALVGDAGIHTLNNLDLAIFSPSGMQWNSTGLGTSENIALEQAEISKGGTGEWNAAVSWTYGDPEVAYALKITVERSPEVRESSVFIGDLAPGEEKEASWRLACKSRSQNNLTITGRCHVHYDHSDATIADDADYERTGRFQILVSDSYANSSGQEGEGGYELGKILSQSRLVGRITGFAALVLIFASIVAGGFPSNEAKVRLNKKFGSGAKRVKFHCWISVFVMALSAFHGIILLLGFYYGTLAGLALGGISLGAMIGMGITGYFHIPIAKKIGYGRWCAIHLSLAFIALLFGLLHTFIDGTTLPRLLGY